MNLALVPVAKLLLISAVTGADLFARQAHGPVAFRAVSPFVSSNRMGTPETRADGVRKLDVPRSRGGLSPFRSFGETAPAAYQSTPAFGEIGYGLIIVVE